MVANIDFKAARPPAGAGLSAVGPGTKAAGAIGASSTMVVVAGRGTGCSLTATATRKAEKDQW